MASRALKVDHRAEAMNGDRGRWQVSAGRLVFVEPDGTSIPASAAEAFRVLFRDIREISGVEVGDPRDDLPDLEFSPSPVDVVVQLAVKAGEARCLPAVEVGGKVHAVESLADQLILDGTWYPVVEEDLSAALAWVNSDRGGHSSPLTAGDVVRIRFDSALPCRLVDDFSITAENLALPEARLVEEVRLEATLYPYQEFGVAYLVTLADQSLGCILGDEMGLGKTLQVIGLLEDQRVRGRGTSLILAPATVLENWRREVHRFAPALKVLPHSGPQRTGSRDTLELADVVITSYETALRDEAMLAQVKWNVLILDEAQAIKSPKAQRTLLVKRLPRRVSIAVTGTPVENRLEDLWSLTDFAVPGLLGSLTDFASRYAGTATDAENLAPVVAPILLRRRIADVAADLPELIETPQFLTSDPIFAEEYDLIRKAAKKGGHSAQLGAIQRLRMLAAGSIAADDGSSLIQEKDIRLLELLGEIAESKQKALIFCSYTHAIDRLESVLSSCGFVSHVGKIDGRTPPAARQLIVDAFGTAAGTGVLLLNPRAAGTGLNITAANHVIHFNPEWNPAVTDQASRRAFRRGQSLPVTVHHLLYSGTIEEAMWIRAHGKRVIAEAALTDTDPELSPSDLSWALEFTPVVRSGED
ncbi:MAG: DEAD/DEAH box helicase [Candidatus Nanopelagicales bacterium]|nr:DEAD/DEAH box helicase [Candidatus Nanopelagicales bacterium]MCF8557743.1 DEAD/DEAH box helicase [Candidatus Nanopelagicales bacterium]